MSQSGSQVQGIYFMYHGTYMTLINQFGVSIIPIESQINLIFSNQIMTCSDFLISCASCLACSAVLLCESEKMVQQKNKLKTR